MSSRFGRPGAPCRSRMTQIRGRDPADQSVDQARAPEDQRAVVVLTTRELTAANVIHPSAAICSMSASVTNDRGKWSRNAQRARGQRARTRALRSGAATAGPAARTSTCSPREGAICRDHTAQQQRWLRASTSCPFVGADEALERVRSETGSFLTLFQTGHRDPWTMCLCKRRDDDDGMTINEAPAI